MSDIRRLGENDYDAFITIVANGFPDFKLQTPEERERFKQSIRDRAENPTDSFYGLFRSGQLLGGMRLIDYMMNVRGVKVLSGGIGMLAVDLLHKKEHVARDIVSGFLDRYRRRGAPFALLYAFRPDFYHQMGFGYGTKTSRYRILPTALPDTGRKEAVTFLTADDTDALRDCYQRVADRTNGMIDKTAIELRRLFESPSTRLAGYREDGCLLGYLAFTFAPIEHSTVSDLNVTEFIYETRDALLGLLAFLRSQRDQVRRIQLDTQDENFHFVLSEPRSDTERIFGLVAHETNVQGLGIMYRLVDVPRAFALLRDADFGGQTITLAIHTSDTFLLDHDGTTVVHFEHGHPRLLDGATTAAVEIRMGVAELSSLLMGAVSFRSLYRYGLADISDPERTEDVTRLFLTDEKPVCTTPF